jgi:hypothetical protein
LRIGFRPVAGAGIRDVGAEICIESFGVERYVIDALGIDRHVFEPPDRPVGQIVRFPLRGADLSGLAAHKVEATTVNPATWHKNRKEDDTGRLTSVHAGAQAPSVRTTMYWRLRPPAVPSRDQRSPGQTQRPRTPAPSAKEASVRVLA